MTSMEVRHGPCRVLRPDSMQSSGAPTDARGTAVATGSKADAFLGTQGDPWDTQWDMLLALIGALASQLLLSTFHGRQIESLRPAVEAP